ncbi:MAG: molybdenum cofactor guanylyltransferase MobA [Alphaproteobacteria bacterium]|nr:molybdenum cofactor guanylyltransferase MobA [Alphaproteobacteria bacterium]
MAIDQDIVGCILAGGLSRRMGGGDKPLKMLGGKTMLDTVIDRFSQQANYLLINANGDPRRMSEYGLPVVPDAIAGHAGPLAGISACMDWVADHHPHATHIATAAADTPFFPGDLVSRLSEAANADGSDIAIATSDGHRHPVFGLWSLSLRNHLSQWMQETDTFKVIVWARLHRLTMVEFPLVGRSQDIDPFFNINTPEDLATADELRRQIESMPGEGRLQ